MKLNNEDKIAGEREEREQETKLKRKNGAGKERENDVVNGVINGGGERERVCLEGKNSFVCALRKNLLKTPQTQTQKRQKASLFSCSVSFFLFLKFCRKATRRNASARPRGKTHYFAAATLRQTDTATR